MIINDDFIKSGMGDGGGLSKKQLAILGIEWPPPKGWKDKVIGRKISDEEADAFIKLRKINSEPHPVGYVEKIGCPNHVFYFDGMCKPINPKGIAIGSYVVYDPRGAKLFEGAEEICREVDEATNNTAEWAGLVLGLRRLFDTNEVVERLEINGDSQIVICSLKTIGKTPALHLQKWKTEAHQILSGFNVEWTANHLYREDNAEADAIGNVFYETVEPFDDTVLDSNHWYQDPASKKQIKYLRILGYSGEVKTKGEAASLIDTLKKGKSLER